MIEGCSCFLRCGMKSAERCTGGSKLIAISSCVGFHFMSSGIRTRRWMPALLTRTLRRGNSFVTHLWSATRWVSLARSQTRVLSPGCFARASASFSSRRPQMITSLPALRNRSASAKPIPDAPPVIRTVFEASCMEDPFVVTPTALPQTSMIKNHRSSAPQFCLRAILRAYGRQETGCETFGPRRRPHIPSSRGSDVSLSLREGGARRAGVVRRFQGGGDPTESDREPRAHPRSARLGAVAGEGGGGVAQRDAASLGPRGEALFRGAQGVR